MHSLKTLLGKLYWYSIQIVALRQWKTWERINQHVYFLNLEKAYDRIPKEKLWKVIGRSRITKNLPAAIKSTYRHQRGTCYFDVNTGIGQWSVLSPLLIIMLITTNYLMLEIVQKDHNMKPFGYADDIAQTGESVSIIQIFINQWNQDLSWVWLILKPYPY